MKNDSLDMNLFDNIPIAYGSLTKEQFDLEIGKGISDIKAGRVYSADEIENEIKRDYDSVTVID